LRGIAKNGFKVSLEDIENSLDEFKGDFEREVMEKCFWYRKGLLYSYRKWFL
jgi:hypothetical protein